MAAWTAFPYTLEYPFDVTSVKKYWKRLHLGDQEPWPTDQGVVSAWALFHSGQFEEAAEAGLKAGPAGITVANKATCIYANFLEANEKTKLNMFLQVADRASKQAQQEPDNANAYYWQGYALGRYSQGISVAKTLAQGVGRKIKVAMEAAIRLQPRHADAHIGLGAFHAEVIDKVGALIGNMTYGAKKDTGLCLLQQGLALAPKSASSLLEYANALVMLEGDKCEGEATLLYERAARSKPLDAMDRLNVELALAELAN